MALRHLILWTALLAPAIPALAADKPVDPRCGTTLARGFVDVYRDADGGRVLIGVHQLDTPFLLVTSLPGGLGSNDVGLDRGQVGRQQMVHFRRVGPRVMLVADNTRFVANSADADERRAATDAFAPSVLWAGSIIARPRKPGCKAHWSQADDQALLLDLGPLLTQDLHGIAPAMGGGPGIAGALKAAGQGDYQLDPERSAALPEAARSFPDNSEFEALLTFTGDGAGAFVNQVAMDASVLTLRQHLSFVRLPPPGYRPRAFHPASGGFSSGQFDFSQPLADALDVRQQVRFRLELDASGKVVRPIVFHLDRGTPEPVRSALLDGARWWSRAFDEAGFPGGFQVELMPVGADPMDIRYNTITWTHRATRGWSYGLVITDPRTGEIIKGAVNLGSQRVRQDILIAEALLAPYAKPDAAARKNEALQMALARLRQLSAHEVGHTLGFNHNFAASRTGNGSVMDYPHPLIALDERGAPRLADAYGVGVGDWDRFIVKHAYANFADEAAGLAQLRADIAAAGYRYAADADARAPGDAHADGALWDLSGMDALAGFDRTVRAREHALRHFGIGVLPPARQTGELEARLVPVYLLHRYQVDAVAHLLGGASYRYGLAGDGAAGTPAGRRGDPESCARTPARHAARGLPGAAAGRARSADAAGDRLHARPRILRHPGHAAVRSARRRRCRCRGHPAVAARAAAFAPPRAAARARSGPARAARYPGCADRRQLAGTATHPTAPRADPAQHQLGGARRADGCGGQRQPASDRRCRSPHQPAGAAAVARSAQRRQPRHRHRRAPHRALPGRPGLGEVAPAARGTAGRTDLNQAAAMARHASFTAL